MYILPAGNPVIPGTVIQTAWANSTMNDLAAGLTGSLAADGQTVPTAPLPMAGFTHTGVGVATQPTQYARADQVQGQRFNVLAGYAFAANAYSGTLPLGITTFPAGMFVIMLVLDSNTGASTLQVNGGPLHNILDANGGPLQAGAFAPGDIALLGWDGAAWRSVLGGAGSDLGFVPVNKAGDTMTGPLTVPTPLEIKAAAGAFPSNDQHRDEQPAAAGTVFGAVRAAALEGVVLNYSSYITFRTEAAWAAGNTSSRMMFHTTPVGSSGAALAMQINGDGTVYSRGWYSLPSALPGAGTFSPSFKVGQSQQCAQTGNITMPAISDIPVGAILRITFSGTNNGTVTWPAGVVWPGGALPDLASGTLKRAVVTVCNDGGFLLGNSSSY